MSSQYITSWMEDMAEEERKKISCPHCGTTYQVPTILIGKTVVCKKCNESFIASESSPPNTPSQLGNLAVKYKLITPEQLTHALSIQAETEASGQPYPLENILLDKKMLSPQHLQLLHLTIDFMKACQVAKEFGKFAVEKGIVSQEQVQTALQKQAALFKEKKTIKYMKDLLVEDGAISKEDRDALVLELEATNKDAGTPSEQNDASPVKALDDTDDQAQGTPAEETEQDDSLLIEAIKEIKPHCDISVSEDRMTAVLSLKKTFPGASPETIHGLMANHNISFGIIDDAAIAAYLGADPLPEAPLEIAKGTAPETGTDGTLAYHFATNQKIGSIGAQGKIDFKDKGEVPYVHKGDLLVEKIPPQEGAPGKDVYGEPIPPDKPGDVKIRFGSGVELSEDALKAHAKADGQPKLSFGGRVSVMSDLEINGDVDLKSGHVDFEGNVKVTGTVQSGFRVKCAALTAKEIMSAEVFASGDVTTTGGIIGATIQAQGDVKAKYIKNANITTYGDIIVEKEVTDAKITASGTCRVTRGKILTAEISAKQGVEAIDIGTDVSSPCRLTVGVDEHIETEIARIESNLDPLIKKRSRFQKAIDKMDEEQHVVHQKIAEMAQVQDRSLVEQRSLQGKLDELALPADSEDRKKLEGAIKALGEKAVNADASLGELFDKQDKLTADTETAQDQISQLEEQIDELNHEREAITAWAKTQKAVPIVKVSGSLYQGTMIKTPRVKTVIKDTCRHAAIREVRLSDENAQNEWELKVQPLK